MKLRYFRVPAFLILAFPISSYAQSPADAQSLGDVARQYREQRQQSEPSHLKVITNDDITTPASRKSAAHEATDNGTANAAQNEPRKEGEETAGDANPVHAKAEKAKKDATKEREEQELALQQRTEEINRVYLDRIAAIRAQINTAQQEMAKLQLDQVESTNSFQRTLGVSPNVSTYQEQQRFFSEQIEARRQLIGNLTAQLEDAQEAARHAGVPHATD